MNITIGDVSEDVYCIGSGRGCDGRNTQDFGRCLAKGYFSYFYTTQLLK